MSIQKAANESFLKPKFKVLADGSACVIALMQGKELPVEFSDDAAELVHHGFASKFTRSDTYILKPALHKFVSGIIKEHQLSNARLPQIIPHFTDMARCYVDYLNAHELGYEEACEKYLDEFHEHCLEILAGTHDAITLASREYDSYHDESETPIDIKMKNNARLYELVGKLQDCVEMLRSGWHQNEQIHEELDGVMSLRHLKDKKGIPDRYGFDAFYQVAIGQHVEMWGAAINTLIEQLKKYFVTLKIASEPIMRANVVSRFLKTTDKYEVHLFQDSSLATHFNHDDLIDTKKSSLFDLWDDYNDAVADELLIFREGLSPKERKVVEKTQVPVEFVDGEVAQGELLPWFDDLACQIMKRVGENRLPVNVMADVNALADTLEQEIEDIYINRNLALQSVLQVIAEHLAAGSNVAVGVKRMVITGVAHSDYDAPGYAMHCDARLEPVEA